GETTGLSIKTPKPPCLLFRERQPRHFPVIVLDPSNGRRHAIQPRVRGVQAIEFFCRHHTEREGKSGSSGHRWTGRIEVSKAERLPTSAAREASARRGPFIST